jgi:hypothetical protein
MVVETQRRADSEGDHSCLIQSSVPVNQRKQSDANCSQIRSEHNNSGQNLLTALPPRRS